MFSLQKCIDDFLRYKPVEGYSANLNVLINFLEEEKKINESIMKVYMQGVRTEVIIESLEYYIRNCKVTAIDTARRYCSCVSEFFKYLIHERIIENNEFGIELGAPAYSESSYIHKINKFIAKDKRLKETEGFISLKEEDVRYLIEQCDITLGAQEVYEKAIIQKKYYNKYRSAVALKLILLTGVRYEVFKEIRKQDVDLTHDLITINGLTIHLPIRLSEQLQKYEHINNVILSEYDDSDCYFLEYEGNSISKKTTTTASFLKGIIGRGDFNGLIKYTIIEMIKKGINESIIRQFTGVGDTIYDECQHYVNEIYNIRSSRYLDSKIRSMEIYDIL